MGIFLSTSYVSASAKKFALKHANNIPSGESSTSVVFYFWTNPKTGIMPVDEHWPVIKHAGKTYIGELGFVGLISYPWIMDMITATCKPPPTFVDGVTYDPPTLELKKYSDDNGYVCKFKTLTSTLTKNSRTVIVEVNTQDFNKNNNNM